MGARRESFRMACHSSFILSVSLPLSYGVFPPLHQLQPEWQMCLFFRLSNSAHLKSYFTSFKKSCRWFQQLDAYESKHPVSSWWY